MSAQANFAIIENAINTNVIGKFTNRDEIYLLLTGKTYPQMTLPQQNNVINPDWRDANAFFYQAIVGMRCWCKTHGYQNYIFKIKGLHQYEVELNNVNAILPRLSVNGAQKLTNANRTYRSNMNACKRNLNLSSANKNIVIIVNNNNANAQATLKISYKRNLKNKNLTNYEKQVLEMIHNAINL